MKSYSEILSEEPKVDDFVTSHDRIFIMLILIQKQMLTGLILDYVILYYVMIYNYVITTNKWDVLIIR